MSTIQDLQVLTAHLHKLKRQASANPRSIHLRVAAQFMDQSLMKQLDMVARLQVLEGVAGVSEGLWSNKSPVSGLASAKKHFIEKPISEEWFLPKDTGLYKRAAFTFAKVLDKINTTSTEELLQGLMAGVGPSGEKVDRMFNAIGEFLKDRILSGKATIIEAANRAAEFVRRRAWGVLKSLKTEKHSGPGNRGEWNVNKPILHVPDNEDHPKGQNGRTDVATFEGMGASTQQDILSHIMDDAADPEMVQIRTAILQALLKRAKTELQQTIIRELLDTLSDNEISKGRVRYEVAERTGVTYAYVRQLEDKMLSVVPKIIANDPHLQKLINRVLDRSEIEAMTSGYKTAKKRSLAFQRITASDPVPF